jgi:hypothetical protein
MINSTAYINTMTKLKRQFCKVGPNKTSADSLPSHKSGNTRSNQQIWLDSIHHIVLIWLPLVFICLVHSKTHCVGHGLTMMRMWFVQLRNGYVRMTKLCTVDACMTLMKGHQPGWRLCGKMFSIKNMFS